MTAKERNTLLLQLLLALCVIGLVLEIGFGVFHWGRSKTDPTPTPTPAPTPAPTLTPTPTPNPDDFLKKHACMQDRLGNCVLCPPGYKTQLTDEEYANAYHYGAEHPTYLDCDPKTMHCNNCYGTKWALPSTNCSSKDKTKCGDKLPWQPGWWTRDIQTSKYSGPVCPKDFRFVQLQSGPYVATAVKVTPC